MKNIKMVTRPVTALVSLIVFSLAAPVAFAVPVFFDFSGNCANNCSVLGVADGTAVSGFFETDDSAFGDNLIEDAEVVDFGFTLGNVSLDPSAFGFSSSLVLNAALNGFDSGTFSVLTLAPFSLFVELEFFDSWFYTEGMGAAASGPGGFARRIDAQPVPEPATAMLLGLGLIGFAIARRSRR